jgi:hypothetical protein
VGLTETVANRAATSITFSWTQGASNGGAPVIDYNILSDKALGTGVFETIASSVATTSYTATGLTAGKTYTFKVEARNSYGLSAPSAPALILCQYVPATPAAPTTVVVGN